MHLFMVPVTYDREQQLVAVRCFRGTYKSPTETPGAELCPIFFENL